MRPLVWRCVDMCGLRRCDHPARAAIDVIVPRHLAVCNFLAGGGNSTGGRIPVTEGSRQFFCLAEGKSWPPWASAGDPRRPACCPAVRNMGTVPNGGAALMFLAAQKRKRAKGAPSRRLPFSQRLWLPREAHVANTDPRHAHSPRHMTVPSRSVRKHWPCAAVSPSQTGCAGSLRSAILAPSFVDAVQRTPPCLPA